MLLENTRLALTSLKANKLRTVLTMLGIIIGIASVIAIVTIGNSMTKTMQKMMTSFGINNIEMYLYQDSSSMMESSGEERPSFQEEWLQEMLAEFPGEIKTISVEQGLGSGIAEYRGKTVSTYIIGISAGYLTANNVDIVAGSPLPSFAYDMGTYDCIVSDLFVEQILGIPVERAPGKTVEIAINGTDLREFHISGVYHFDYDTWVMNYGDRSTKRENVSTSLYIAYHTVNDYYEINPELGYFTVVAQDGTDTNDLAMRLKAFFDSKMPEDSNYRCETYSMQSMVEDSKKSLAQITLAISMIAGIALLVGGIGVMNIMMVSITERTREIGTRKALGAPNSAIRIQFITEAIILCLIGGMMGIIIGVLIGMLGSKLMGFSGEIAVWSILVAVGFSMLIGVFFGYYPANKAAKMDPIVALSYE